MFAAGEHATLRPRWLAGLMTSYPLRNVRPGLREARLALPPCGVSVRELTLNRTQFAFRIDRWDRDGHTIMDHVADVENLLVAMAAYEAACRHWPGETITLRQGVRVIEDSRKERLA
jgi:hypothetical protein